MKKRPKENFKKTSNPKWWTLPNFLSLNRNNSDADCSISLKG